MGEIHWHFEVPLGTYLKFLVNVQGKHINIKEADCKQKGYIKTSMLVVYTLEKRSEKFCTRKEKKHERAGVSHTTCSVRPHLFQMFCSRPLASTLIHRLGSSFFNFFSPSNDRAARPRYEW